MRFQDHVIRYLTEGLNFYEVPSANPRYRSFRSKKGGGRYLIEKRKNEVRYEVIPGISHDSTSDILNSMKRWKEEGR